MRGTALFRIRRQLELPAGNVHSGDDWQELLLPEIERAETEKVPGLPGFGFCR
jgi:hypothetical protein